MTRNRLDEIPEIVASKAMTVAEIAVALNLHPQNVRERVYALTKQGVLEIVLPRTSGNRPQHYRATAKEATNTNAFTSVRPRGTGKGRS